MSTKLIAQTVSGPQFATVGDDGWTVRPFMWTDAADSRRYGLAGVNEFAPAFKGYIDEWGEVAWGRLYEEKGREAWNFFAPLGLDIEASLAPDPAPSNFVDCCEVLAGAMGLMSITADGQQLWAITSTDDDIADDEAEDVDEVEDDEEFYEDEDA